MASLVNRAWLTLLACALPCLAHAVPPDFQNETLITGLTQPTGLVFTPDQRMLIIQRAGRIWVVQPGAAQVDPVPFHDITNINVADGERGLVGITLDPNFATNNYYYVFYTANSPLVDRVSRFTANGNTTVAGSELVLWQDTVTSPSYHHGGGLAFGPDGFLYISTGDHFEAGRAQQLDYYHGKILRIASNGTIPTNNPFYDGAGPNLDAIWARGLRNPFRITFDSATGTLYINDNGDNDPATSIEEIQRGVAGANYGWPVCQGNCGTAGMTSPIFAYAHAGRDASITGGVMYRGTQFPTEYQGSYFYADYVQNWIRRVTFDQNGNVTGSVNFEPVDGTTDGPYGEIVHLTVGPEGALYYVNIGTSWEGGVQPGTVRRIRYTASNQPPVAQAAADPTQGLPPLMVNFSSAGSIDPEGQPLSYAWTFGDGTTSTQANPSRTYTNNGTYVARLSVSDGALTSLSNPITITVGTPPTPVINSPTAGATFRAGDLITFSGSATDGQGNPMPASALTWNIEFLHDNHSHPALGPVSNITGGNFTIASTGHDYRGLTRYQIMLSATDADGLTGSTSVLIFPQKVNLTMNTTPADLTLLFDGISQTAPFLWDALIGFRYTLEAPNQSVGGNQYNFTSWSDGGARVHTITVPAQDRTYTANYQASPLPPGLILAYRFNEGTGGTTADWTGNNRNGTLANAVWTTSGRYNGGLTFNGTNGRVDGPSMTLPAAFTLMAWVLNPSNNGYETLMSVGRDRDLYLLNGVLTLEGPVPGTIRTFGELPVNSWRHIAVVSNGTDVRAYLNGVPLGTPQAALTTAFTGVFNVGAWNNAGAPADYFSGTMDEVRVYNAALTQAQVQIALASAAHADADGDGVHDIYETNTGVYVSPTNTGTSAANADSDGDGFTDATELADSTNPNNAASNLPRANVYVQFGAPAPHMGTPAYPVATLGAASRMVQNGGTIRFINTGNTGEALTLNRPMTIRAEGGLVRVGMP